MFKKFIWINFIACLLINGALIAAKVIEPAIYEESFTPVSVARTIKSWEERGHSNKSAKGIVGETVATRKIEDGNIAIQGYRLKSIQSVFREKGCSVSLKHSGDRGIDDVFVVQGHDG